MGTSRYFDAGTTGLLDVLNGNTSDETDINDVIDEIETAFNHVEDDMATIYNVSKNAMITKGAGQTALEVVVTPAVDPITYDEYELYLENSSGNKITAVQVDGTLAGDSDTLIPTQKSVKAYVDTGLALKLDDSQLDTSTDLDGVLASDTKIPSQLAVKTYVDLKDTETVQLNRVRNAEILVNQRPMTSSFRTITSTGGVVSNYLADRFRIVLGNTDELVFKTIPSYTTVPLRGSTPEFGISRGRLRIFTFTPETAFDNTTEYVFPCVYTFPGYDVADLEEQDITLSFMFKSTVADTHSIALVGDNDNLSYVTNFVYDTPNTEVTIVKNITLPTGFISSTDGNLGFRLYICGLGLATQTTTNENTWEIGEYITHQNATFDWVENTCTLDIGGIILKLGTHTNLTLQPKHLEDYYYECYPFYRKSGDAKENSGVYVNNTEYIAITTGVIANKYYINIPLIPNLIYDTSVTPISVTTYNNGAANSKWRNRTGGADSGTPTTSVSETCLTIDNPQVAGDNSGDRLSISWSISTEETYWV